jgi:hypothetical protein
VNWRIVRPPFRRGGGFLDSRKPNLVLSDDGGDGDTDFALGKLPPQELRILSESLDMLCQGEWQPRQLTITDDFLMICLTGSDDILDKVPLVCVVELRDVRKCTNSCIFTARD